MIDLDVLRQAIEQSNDDHPEDPVESLRAAGIDDAIVLELVKLVHLSYVGKQPTEILAGALASGLELGARAARIHDAAQDAAQLRAIAGELAQERPRVEHVRQMVEQALARLRAR